MGGKSTKSAELVPIQSSDSLFEVAKVADVGVDEAGLGSEDVGSSDIILPRAKLLQSNSPEVEDEIEGAKSGVWWLTPANRPLTPSKDDKAMFVVVRIYPSQRHWTPIDSGGGLLCEAAGGDLIAREPNGITGARLVPTIDEKTNEVTAVAWSGGRATDICSECQYGPGAGPNGWLPKIVRDDGGNSVTIPDTFRKPKCDRSLDILCLMAVPPYGDLPGSIEPAFISFGRTSAKAGRQLSGMIKVAMREPAWSKIFTLGSSKVSNDFGSWYVSSVAMKGYAQRQLMDRAKALYESAKDQSFKADVSDGAGDVYSAPAVDEESGGGDGADGGDAPNPEDKF